MTSSWNSSPPYEGGTVDSLHESIGIPQFSGGASEAWAFVFNGMIFQGGLISVPNAITTYDYPAPFTKQVLGIFMQPQTKGHAPGVVSALNNFTVDHTGSIDNMFWFAVGV